ncbi:MAG: metallophosphoesterase family protein [Candidatus Krumholzibacteriota bacterium]|nr:metallophosphoesterase family protein [Candidatus Krumholzibacteriota bacterium]
MSGIAVISDIHGNHRALGAVFADIDRRGIGRIVNLGDSLYGPLDPRRTAEMLLARPITTVRGNEDRLLIGEAADADPTARHVRGMLSGEHLRWLESLPAVAHVEGGIVCFHASPDADDEYLLWDVTPAGAVERDAAAVASRLDGYRGALVLCGHDHVPRVIALSGGTLVVDPGSVGCPAFADAEPYPHVMETGSPAARYAVLHQTRAGWEVEPVSVRYDCEAVARLAERGGRDDWAAWLRTGRTSA